MLTFQKLFSKITSKLVNSRGVGFLAPFSPLHCAGVVLFATHKLLSRGVSEAVHGE